MYLFNHFNILIIFILLAVGYLLNAVCFVNLGDNLLLSQMNESSSSIIDVNMLYSRLIVINFFIIMIGNNFSQSGNRYHELIVNYEGNEYKFFLSKVVVLITSIILYYLILFMIISFTGLGITNWFDVHHGFLKLMVTSLLITIIYGLLSAIFQIIIPSNFAGFIAVGINVGISIIDSLIDNKNIAYYLELFFPIMSDNYSNYSIYGILHLIIMVLIYVQVLHLVYHYKKV